MAVLVGLTMVLVVLAIAIGLIGLKVYGVVLSFQKKWYIGVAALLVPFFAEIIALSKLLFKKDLLA